MSISDSLIPNKNSTTSEQSEGDLNLDCLKRVLLGGKVIAIAGGVIAGLALLACMGYFGAPALVPALDIFVEGVLAICTGGSSFLGRVMFELVCNGRGLFLIYYAIPKYIAAGIYSSSALTTVGIPLALASGGVFVAGSSLTALGMGMVLYADRKIKKRKLRALPQESGVAS